MGRPKKATRKVKPIDKLFEKLRSNLEDAIASESYLVAVFRYENEHIHGSWISSKFPVLDFDTVVDLLDQDLRKEKTRILEGNDGYTNL